MNMHKRLACYRALVLAVLVLAAWLVAADQVWAQGGKKKKAEQPVEQSYMLSYCLTGLAIAIGIGAVCMPSQRKDEVPLD